MGHFSINSITRVLLHLSGLFAVTLALVACEPPVKDEDDSSSVPSGTLGFISSTVHFTPTYYTQNDLRFQAKVEAMRDGVVFNSILVEADQIFKLPVPVGNYSLRVTAVDKHPRVVDGIAVVESGTSVPDIVLIHKEPGVGVGNSRYAIFGGGGYTDGSLELVDMPNNTSSVIELPNPRTVLAATSVEDSFYFVGGRAWLSAGVFENSDKVDIYNSATKIWSTEQLSQPRFVGSNEVASIDGQVFAGGIYSSGGQTFSVMDVRRSNGTWTAFNLPGPRIGSAITAGLGKVFVIGGAACSSGDNPACAPKNSMDVIDSNSLAITQVALPRGRVEAVAVFKSGKLYIAGGVDHNRSFTTALDIYDVAGGTWSTSAISLGRTNMVAGSIGNKIVFAGGIGNSNLIASNVDVFDPAASTWKSTNLTTGRYGLKLAVTDYGSLLAGGVGTDGTTSIIDEYDANAGANYFIETHTDWFHIDNVGPKVLFSDNSSNGSCASYNSVPSKNIAKKFILTSPTTFCGLGMGIENETNRPSSMPDAYRILSDNGGVPGAILFSPAGAPSRISVSISGRSRGLGSHVNFCKSGDSPITLQAGTYWMIAYTNQPLTLYACGGSNLPRSGSPVLSSSDGVNWSTATLGILGLSTPIASPTRRDIDLFLLE